jgi:hypothetical protein
MLALCLGLLLATPRWATALEGQGDYSREQLAQMVAPVALYPDVLLSQVLMGATYPLEVVAADRWVRRNPLLTGANLDEALRDRDWDISVKALCHVPTVLALMSERLDETTNLGNAFLVQEGAVLAMVQELRSHAYRQGNLRSNDKQKVIVSADGSISIAPADPQTVYVPYYNTRYIYGSWWYPAWPPWYWGPDEIVIGSAVYFWPDVYLGFGFGFGYWSYPDWSRRTIIFDTRRRPRFFHRDRDWQSYQGRWRHEPRHRRGVVYRDRSTAERFGQVSGGRRVYDREVRGFRQRDRVEGSPIETRRENAVRGPLAPRGGSISVPAARGGAVELERRSRISTTPTPGRTLVPPDRERSRETVRRTAPAQLRQSGTVFGGGRDGREESRSSIRGRSSRGGMERGGSDRGGSRDRLLR